MVSVPIGKSSKLSVSRSSASTTTQWAWKLSVTGSAIISAKQGASTTDATAL
jgi:hypothetical protein